MLHFGTYNPYDDDDDDDIYSSDEEDDYDYEQETNSNTDNQNTKNMNNWLKRNWFITLRTKNEMRHISFINIIEVNTTVEQQNHFLNLVTSAGTYKCAMPQMSCRNYTTMFHEGDLNRYDLHNIMCDFIEFMSNK